MSTTFLSNSFVGDDSVSQVKKAVILAAGKGSRLLPITKAIPKPMLPLYNRPALSYILDEVFESGIEEVLVVIGHAKQVIIDHFGDDPRLSFLEQTTLNGTAGALLFAKPFIKNDAFALIYADDIEDSPVPCLKRLISVFDSQSPGAVLSVEPLIPDDISRYNAITLDDNGMILDIVEKPLVKPEKAKYTAPGRMILTSSIFPILERLTPNEKNGELVLTDALTSLVKMAPVHGVISIGKRFDIGSHDLWLAACNHFANKQKGSNIGF
jgi:UTP--glucose-1-phosphate uridylyltransferase